MRAKMGNRTAVQMAGVAKELDERLDCVENKLAALVSFVATKLECGPAESRSSKRPRKETLGQDLSPGAGANALVDVHCAETQMTPGAPSDGCEWCTLAVHGSRRGLLGRRHLMALGDTLAFVRPAQAGVAIGTLMEIAPDAVALVWPWHAAPAEGGELSVHTWIRRGGDEPDMCAHSVIRVPVNSILRPVRAYCAHDAGAAAATSWRAVASGGGAVLTPPVAGRFPSIRVLLEVPGRERLGAWNAATYIDFCMRYACIFENGGTSIALLFGYGWSVSGHAEHPPPLLRALRARFEALFWPRVDGMRDKETALWMGVGPAPPGTDAASFARATRCIMDGVLAAWSHTTTAAVLAALARAFVPLPSQ